jgi:rubrerythrin
MAELNYETPASETALGASDDGSVVAAAERLSQFRCVTCGYGASCKIAPERCPMCGGGSWEYQERGRPKGSTWFSSTPLDGNGRL